MSHFAKIVNNKVQETIVAEQDFVDLLEGKWVQYWKNARGESEKRYNPASLGVLYDEINDAFIPPQTFNGWVLDNNFKWQPPTPLPPDTETHYYYWDNDEEDWVAEEFPED